MSDWLRLVHDLIGVIASFVFFTAAIVRAVSLWGTPMEYNTRLLRRIESTGYFIASNALSIYLYVKWQH